MISKGTLFNVEKAKSKIEAQSLDTMGPVTEFSRITTLML